MRISWTYLPTIVGLLASPAQSAIQIDFTNQASIKAGAKQVTQGLLQYYTPDKPGSIPGLLPQPYYWWESGAMFGALVDYWFYTGDDQYNDMVTKALQFQVGPNNDFMPPNQTKDEGNDDQSFWAMATLAAAEHKFPDPPSGQPSWLALAQAVFNLQASRWDAATCNGGLRWQIFTFNTGYNYKNTISNALFFNMATRLGRYTGNQTYFDWANKMWDWMDNVGLMDSNWHFYDGTDSNMNCSQINHIEWTYNAGAAIYGAAIMWNTTQDQKWQTAVNGILDTTSSESLFFAKGSIMTEVACETNNNCDTDQKSFKGYLARWLGATSIIAPFAAQKIMPLLQSSAQAAISTCTGGADGNQCGLKWTQPFDGSMGVGEELAVLEVIQSNLAPFAPGPVTAGSGGTSKSDPSAGGGQSRVQPGLDVITTKDRAGAGILTTMVLVGMVGGSWWMAAK